MASPHNFLQIITKGHSDSTGDSLTYKIENVYTYYRAGASATPSKVNAVTAFKAAVLPDLMACLSEDFLMDSIDYRWIDDYQDQTVSEVSALIGGVAGDSLPIANCVTLQLVGPLRGNGSHGSKHYAPIPESHTLQSNLTAPAIALWDTFRASFISGFVSDTFNFVPFIPQARPKGVPFEYDAVSGQPVAQTKLNTTLGTMLGRRKSR